MTTRCRLRGTYATHWPEGAWLEEWIISSSSSSSIISSIISIIISSSSSSIIIIIMTENLHYHPHPHYGAPCMEYLEGSTRPIYACRPRKYVTPGPL